MPARKEEDEILEYGVNDPGILTIPRSKIESEIHTKVKSNAQAYVKRGFEGRKVIVLVLRE